MSHRSAKRQQELTAYLSVLNEPMPSHEIAKQLGVSQSTLERDLSALRRAGHLIHAKEGRGGGVLLASTGPVAHSVRPASDMQDMQFPFVGRREELAALRAACLEATTGCHTVLVSGDPGIGKSALVDQFVREQSQSGHKVGRGYSMESSTAPPFWPWLQALRDVSPTESTELQRITIDDRLSEPSASADPGASHGRVLLTKHGLFERFASAMPVSDSTPPIIVIEDLQWADPLSLELLAFLTLRESPALIIGVFSGQGRRLTMPGTALQRLHRSNRLTRIYLKPLAEADASLLVRSRSSTALDEKAIGEIVRRAEGSPLLIAELAKYVGNMHQPVGAHLTGSWPDGEVVDGLHEVIASRLHTLSEPCYSVLGRAAFLGRNFTVHTLRSLLGSDVLAADNLIELLDEALDTGHLQVNEEGEAYTFTHSLVRQVIIEELPLATRVRTHAAAGTALEGVYGPDAAKHAEELAHHFLAGSPVCGNEKAIEYSLLAAQRARAVHAHAEAAHHYRNLLELPANQISPDLRFRIIGYLGQAMAAYLPRQRKHEAVTLLRDAVNHFLDSEQVDLAVEFALTDMVPIAGGDGTGTDIVSLVELVLPHLTERPRLRGRALARIAQVLPSEHPDRLLRARDLAMQASAIAADLRDDELAVNASRALLAVNFRRDTDPQTVVLDARRLIATAETIGDKFTEIRGRFYLTSRLMSLGRNSQAEPVARLFLERSEQFGDTGDIEQAVGMNANLANRFGDWPRARALSISSIERFGENHWATGPMDYISVVTGDTSTIDAPKERVIQFSQRDVFAAMELAAMLFANRPEAVEPRLVSAAQEAIGTSPTTGQWLDEHVRQVLSALIVARTGSDTQAGLAYSDLSTERFFIMQTLGIHPERLLAMCATRAGDSGLAMFHLKRAIEYYETERCRPELAISLVELVELKNLFGRGRLRTVRDLQRAESIATDLGMAGVLNRIELLRNASHEPANSPEHLRSSDGLTRRERDVLNLIASGRSNRQIAADLVISENTVTRHVTNIYAKIHASNRAEATAYVLGHSLDLRLPHGR